MKKILFCLICLFLTSCGHTVYTSSKGLGIQLSWNPDSLVPSFRGGEYNVTAFVPRGNSNMSMTTGTGGILGTGGTSQTMTVSTGIQFNQGNITKVLNNPFTQVNTKTELVKILPAIIKPPTPPSDTVSKTAYASGATGPNAILIKPQTLGTDKIIDKIAQNSDAIKDVANTAITTTGDTAKVSFVTAVLATKWALIAAIIGIVIIIGLIVILIKYIISIINKKKLTATITPVAGKILINNETQNNIPANEFISQKKQK